MAILTDRTYDYGLGLDMMPIVDPQRFGGTSNPQNAPVWSHHNPVPEPASAVGLRTYGRPASGRNKTMAYLRAKHPHLAKMVNDGISVKEAFRRATAERQSQPRNTRAYPHLPIPVRGGSMQNGGQHKAALSGGAGQLPSVLRQGNQAPNRAGRAAVQKRVAERVRQATKRGSDDPLRRTEAAMSPFATKKAKTDGSSTPVDTHPLKRRMVRAFVYNGGRIVPGSPSEVSAARQSIVSALGGVKQGRNESTPPDNWRRGTLAPVEKNTRTGELRWAVPEVVLGAWDAFTLPGDVYAGRVDPMSEEGFQRTMGLAGLATGGGIASPKPIGAVSMGARRPAKPFYKWRNTPEDEVARKVAKTLDTGITTKVFREDVGVFDIERGNSKYGLDHMVIRRNEQGFDGEAFVREDLAPAFSLGKLDGFESRRQFGKNTRSAVIKDQKSGGVIGLDFLGKPRKRLKSAYPKKN